MRFLILTFLSISLLCCNAQPKATTESSINDLLDRAKARLDVSDYTDVNEILQLVQTRLDSNTPPDTRYYYHKVKGMCMFEMRNIPEAQKHFEVALEISEKLNDSLMIAHVNSELGKTYTLQGAYGVALEHYEKSLSYFPEMDDSYTSTLMNMSLTYKGLNQYDKALSVLAKGKPYYEGIGNYKSLGILENNIGEIYRDNIKDLDQAKAHYHRAIAANKKANSEAGLAQNYHNLAAMFLELEKTDSALHYAKLSMGIKEKLGDEGGIASASYILADVYFQQGDYTGAISSFEKSLMLSKKFQLMEGIYYNSVKLGKIYQKQGDLNKSEGYFLNAREVAEGSEDLHIIGSSYNHLYELYKDKGDFQNALIYNEKLKAIGDSIAELKAAQNLDELRTQYESYLAN